MVVDGEREDGEEHDEEGGHQERLPALVHLCHVILRRVVCDGMSIIGLIPCVCIRMYI